jgi:hypothetical protein
MSIALTQKNSKEELAKLDSQFLAWSPEEREKKWLEWVENFASTTLEDEYNSRYSWFRFFTIATWDDLNARNTDFFVDFVISRQIPLAVLANYSILDKIMFYFYFRATSLVEMRELYSQARDAFTRSEAILGKSEDGYYTISQAAKDLLLIKSRGRDAVEMASFMDKLRRAMFPNDGLSEIYFTDNQNEALGRLVDLIDMFLEIEPDNIYSLVLTYVHPGVNEGALAGLADETNLPEKTVPRVWPRYIEVPASVASVAPVQPVAERPIVKNITPPALPKEEKKVAVTIVPTHAEIRAKIDAAFEADADGQYEDLDNVLAALEKAALKYNDPKISELYYFDESSGKFKWSV